MLKYATLTSLALLLFFSGCDHDKKKSETAEMQKTSATVISLKPIEDANGSIKIVKTQNGFALENDPNKILIIDIFATWCPPCRAEAAVLGDIQKKFKKDVQVLGISIEEDVNDEMLAAYKKRYHADYTLTNSNNNQKLIDAVAENLKIGRRFPIPLVAVYKGGKLVNYYSGATEEEFIVSDIKQAIGQ